MKATDIEVTKRAIFGGRRRSVVYDARYVNAAGERYSATEPSKKEAIAALLADVGYVAAARRVEAHGCKLYAQGARQWVFELPSSGGCMCFEAADFVAALARVAKDYVDHEGCAAFFAEISK